MKKNGQTTKTFSQTTLNNRKNATIESLHNSYLKRVQQDDVQALIERSETLQREKMEIEKKLKDLKVKELPNFTDNEIYQMFLLDDRLVQIENEFLQLQKEDTETELTKYYLTMGKVLFDYYKEEDNEQTTGEVSKDSVVVNESLLKEKKSILELFKKEEDEVNYKLQNATKQYLKLQSESIPVDQSLDVHLDEEEDEDDGDICETCGVEKILNRVEAIMICPSCSKIDHMLIDSNKPHYKDLPREFSSYSYKRINHFNEWLAQFQAKESTDIPDDVYNKILIELKKERTTDVNKINAKKIKEILKRLDLSKFYEHVPHIIHHITGQPAPVMTRATEEKLRNMFKEIQTPFLLYCPEKRKNFLSYSYVLYKFCQLLGLDEFLPSFTLLKSREKLHQQDIIWEQICNTLSWEFIKSV
jgi:hypothetical protein